LYYCDKKRLDVNFPKKYLDTYTLGDAFPIMEKIPDESVDLMFTSIPDISQMNTETSENEYLKFITEVCDFAKSAVKPSGFIVFSQQDRRLDGTIFPKHVKFINEMTEGSTFEIDDWYLKDEKIVIKDGVDKGSPLFQFTYQYLSVFTKTGKIKRKGEYLRDVIVDVQVSFGGQKVWSIPFCTTIIEALTKKGDVVIDPFAGAGPVLFAAKQSKRHYWGAEIDGGRYNHGFQLFTKGLFGL
jgi:hypothetical protein